LLSTKIHREPPLATVWSEKENGESESLRFKQAFEFKALFRDLNLARADGSLRQLLRRLERIDVLVVDDWVMAPMSEPERRDFWEIAEDRFQTRSMILTSQLSVSRWHEQIEDPTMADGILDLLVDNAHRIEMRGDFMRKQRSDKKG
jgi:DNA replication protein DnaC